jgi:hypothetical protein
MSSSIVVGVGDVVESESEHPTIMRSDVSSNVNMMGAVIHLVALWFKRVGLFISVAD